MRLYTDQIGTSRKKQPGVSRETDCGVVGSQSRERSVSFNGRRPCLGRTTQPNLKPGWDWNKRVCFPFTCLCLMRMSFTFFLFSFVRSFIFIFKVGSLPIMGPNAGLDLRTVRSRPELISESDA